VRAEKFTPENPPASILIQTPEFVLPELVVEFPIAEIPHERYHDPRGDLGPVVMRPRVSLWSGSADFVPLQPVTPGGLGHFCGPVEGRRESAALESKFGEVSRNFSTFGLG
jgi:hypothetical protein